VKNSRYAHRRRAYSRYLIAALLASAAIPLFAGVAYSASAKKPAAHQTASTSTAPAKASAADFGQPGRKPVDTAQADPTQFETSAREPAESRAADAPVIAVKERPVPREVQLLVDQALPELLNDADVARYRTAFQLQDGADWAGADEILAAVNDRGLTGTVLAQRYLHPRYKVSYAELRDWLEDYSDHPDAKKIYELALKRKPKTAKNPAAPKVADGNVPAFPKVGVNLLAYDQAAFETKVYEPKSRLSGTERKEYEKFLAKAEGFLHKGNQAAFKKLLVEDKDKSLMSAFERDRLEGRLAASYYASGDDTSALASANLATKKSGRYLPDAHWIGGLAAWRLGKYDEAAAHFADVSHSEYASQWQQSAGAFWAARANVRMKRPAVFMQYVKQAGEYPRTFYGLLARAYLGHDSDFNWSPPPLDERGLQELAANPGGRRAVMLLQVGDENRAERELHAMYGKTSKELTEAMLALADRAQMPSLAMRLGTLLVRNGAPMTDATAFPAPALTTGDGEVIDRELVLALIRQESGFNPDAKSKSGARGLMQLMPGTANFVARSENIKGGEQHKLYDPEVNLMLGQKYIDILLKDTSVTGDLFRMVAAWNAGPGNLAKWSKTVRNPDDDPLLFIESIPSRETRQFSQRVLTNYWIYRERFHQPTNSLVAVAGGKWPFYHSDRSNPFGELAEDGSKKQ
jgi:soluble lytic murein transglycosylase